MGTTASSPLLRSLTIALAIFLFLRWRKRRRLHGTPASGNAVVHGLFYYPVKGCRAIKLDSVATLCETGILYDRRWMIIDKDRVFISQRRMRQLALLDVEVIPACNQLKLSLPNHGTIVVLLISLRILLLSVLHRLASLMIQM